MPPLIDRLRPFCDAAQHPDIPLLRVAPLDRVAIYYWRRDWRPATPQRKSFEWEKIQTQLSRREAQCCGIALFAGVKLFGLASLSLSHASVAVEAVEGWAQRPWYLRGRVLPCLLDMLDCFAVAEGLEQIRIHQPSKPLHAYYAQQPGYVFASGPGEGKWFEKTVPQQQASSLLLAA